ncbi:MAG: twin-arginine translocation signal domain-containing protein, partial [Pseudomonadota bacterium]|nr:twin-arginine translocation signal domain-containing protein [Pseudomonadota bacterium]
MDRTESAPVPAAAECGQPEGDDALNRRQFLGAATRLGGLVLALSLPLPRTASARSYPASAELNAWLSIAPDDSITIL